MGNTHSEEDRIEELQASGAHIVFEAISREGEEEVKRSSAGLGFSALAAGLSIGFSFVAQAALQSRLPDAEWAHLITKLGYSVGFLMVILGRQQLFTENTLTPVLPLLDRASHVRLRDVGRLWNVVLLANLIAAAAFAFAVAKFEFFGSDMRQSFHQLGIAAYEGTFAQLLVGGVFAGYLIAAIAWLQPAAENSRWIIIVILTYVIGVAGFPHIIAGSVDVFYLVAEDRLSFGSYFGYMLPVLLGNTLGGVALVAALNYAQVAAGKEHESANSKIIT